MNVEPRDSDHHTSEAMKDEELKTRDDSPEPDYQAMIEQYMRDNADQFELDDPEQMEEYRPIFMIGPCKITSALQGDD